MKRLIPVAALAIVLLAACGGTDRPEGVVERWLVSLNQGKAGEPEKYASGSLSERILPHWEDRDPGDLDVIEVGKGIGNSSDGHVLATIQMWRVPFRVERTSGVGLEGTVELTKASGEWRVQSLRLGDHSLRVPSEGGEHIGSASAGAWALALGISAALMLLVATIMRLTPKPMPLPVRTHSGNT